MRLLGEGEDLCQPPPARRGGDTALAAQPAHFVAFDMLALEGEDLRGRPLSERRRTLEQAMAPATPPLQLAPQTIDVEQARASRKEYATTPVGVEEVVAKALAGRYLGGRLGWLKVRVRAPSRRWWRP